MRKPEISNFHLITCDHPSRDLFDLVKDACEGGIDWIQLRIKNKSEDEILKSAAEIREITRKHKVSLIINDHVTIALQVGADGVHLGKKDMDPLEARKLLGSSFIIGGTANTIDDVRKLTDAGVDYIGAGPFRFTSTKKDLSPVLGKTGIAELCSSTHLPVIAIGGINTEDIDELKLASIHGIAVASAVMHAADIPKEIQNFKSRLIKK